MDKLIDKYGIVEFDEMFFDENGEIIESAPQQLKNEIKALRDMGKNDDPHARY
jgi:biotin synthase-related radical SAM superfamily protein